MRKLLTYAAGLLCAGVMFALAQTTPIRNFTGNETMRLTLGSGSAIDVTLSQVRNTRGISPIATGTTVNVSPSAVVGYLVASGAITTLNVTLPNPADKGQLFYIANGHSAALTGINAFASTGTQTQTLNASYSSQTLSPSSAVGWIYDYDNSKWFRIQ